MKRFTGALALLFGILSLLFLFQNCGQGVGQSTGASVSGSETPFVADPTPTPVADPTPTPILLRVQILDSNQLVAGQAQVQVHANKAVGEELAFSFRTENSSALAGVHFRATAGTVSIASGGSVGGISIPILASELDKDVSFSVILGAQSGSLGAQVTKGTALVTITKDTVRRTLTGMTVALSGTGGPGAAVDSSIVWTGQEFLVFGGFRGTAVSNVLNGYNPATNTWRIVPTLGGLPPARMGHSAVWTGSRMLIFGGANGNANSAALGAGNLSFFNDLFSFDPATATWTRLNPAAAPGLRGYHSAVWTGDRMLVYAGRGLANANGANADGVYSDLRAYNPANNTWTELSSVGPTAPRFGHSAVWTGGRMIVFGGASRVVITSNTKSSTISFTVNNDLRAFDLATLTWTALNSVATPFARTSHATVYDGSQIVIYGGHGAQLTGMNDAHVLDVKTLTWNRLNLSPAQTGRYGHEASFGNGRIHFVGGQGASNVFGLQ